MEMRVERFRDPMALMFGLRELKVVGLTTRGLLFLALDPAGAIFLVIPDDLQRISRIKVGEKLSLTVPIALHGRLYHYDSIHRLPGGWCLYNGDRRLHHPGDAAETAGLMADFLQLLAVRNVFFGCTPHQPGSWLLHEESTEALHDAGFVEVVPVQAGLLARRIHDHWLWFLATEDLLRRGPPELWRPVFESPLGNVLMLERRIIGDRLVLTCEAGLVEVDVSCVPAVHELSRVPVGVGFGVVGRVEGAAFAVTYGRPMPWGLDELRPAVLVGAEGGTLEALGEALRRSLTTTDS